MLFRRRDVPQVACATDPTYLPHCAAMLHSLISHQRGRVHIQLLAASSLTNEDIATLTGWVEEQGAAITVTPVDESLLGETLHNFSMISWYRLLAPELLPGLDRAIYLDCDLIVTDSLDPLWRTRLRGNLLGAVTNLPMSMEWMEKRCEWLGIPGVDGYFNAGVMLMDLEGLRRGGWSRKVIDYSVEHHDDLRELDEGSPREIYIYTVRHPDRLLFPDQDALNAILHDRRLPIHPRWNLQLLFRRFETRTEELTEAVVAEALADPAIRHFEGPGHSKPWHPDADPGDRALYEKHRSQTPWPLPG